VMVCYILHLNQHAWHILGLLNDHGEWHDAMNEASIWTSDVHLRNMFYSILMFSEIADPFKLWESHWVHLIDDLLRAT